MIRGMGPKKTELLRKLGIKSETDLLFYFPRQYEDRSLKVKISEVVDEEYAYLTVKVSSQVNTRFLQRGMRISRVDATDGSGFLALVFFNQPYIGRWLKPGQTYDVYGKIKKKNRTVEMVNPIIEAAGGNKTGRIVPIYGLTKGLTQTDLQSFTTQAVEQYADDLPTILPEALLEKRRLMPRPQAVAELHLPRTMESLETAYRTLVYEEFFTFSLGMALVKAQRGANTSFSIPLGELSTLTDKLPFTLTAAQARALDEILADMASGQAMNRLLQGDVGSGKTIVAFLAMYNAYLAGYQSVFMAPTEILARQHTASLEKLLEFSGVRVKLLLGSTPERERKLMLAQLQNGAIDMLISTHAAIQEDVKFQNLALTVTDEQHRFGVKQRARLSEKGDNPHVLVMSATPIPRTVALLWYADLDISSIDELPKGRIPIDTIVITPEHEARMAEFVRKNLANGRQAFIICPLIEENEELAIEAVESLYQRLSTTHFKNERLAFLHGKKPTAEKERIMRAFSEHETDILIATTVIEVGIDIPNANVMVVYNAERFGLAQLHQLRGRVGRGSHASYCVLINSGETNESKERMRIMQRTNDGFEIASEDLRMRGTGELLGERQHGMPMLLIGDIHRDRKIFMTAKEDAQKVLASDPDLSEHAHRWLRLRVKEKFADIGDGIVLN